MYGSGNARSVDAIKRAVIRVFESNRELNEELDPGQLPCVEVHVDMIPVTEMPRLYASADAFVLPTRGEGFGLPIIEAMAMGLPTIATNFSGQTEFMREQNSYLIKVEGMESAESIVPSPAGGGGGRMDWSNFLAKFNKKSGQGEGKESAAAAAEEEEEEEGKEEDKEEPPKPMWAKPSVDHLRALMRYVFENREEAKKKGEQARKDIIERFSLERINELSMRHLRRIEAKIKAKKEKIGVIKVQS